MWCLAEAGLFKWNDMKILIVKCSALGDIVHTYPVIDYLHKKHSPSLIDWAVDERCKGLVESHPYIHQTINFCFKNSSLREFFSSVKNLRKTHYDLIIDLQGNCKSGLLTLLAKGKKKIGFSYSCTAEWPNILATKQRFAVPPRQNIREDYLSLVQQFFNDKEPFIASTVKLKAEAIEFNLKDKVVVAPGSRWPNKCLSEEKLKEILTTFSSPLVFLWGNKEEKESCQRLIAATGGTLLPKLSLPQLQNLLQEAELLIGMDSLPLHLAASVGTPTLSFFGPSSKNKYAPLGKQHTSYQGSCPYGIQFEKRCPKLRTCRSGACLKEYPITFLVTESRPLL